jgi:hypothetical protein
VSSDSAYYSVLIANLDNLVPLFKNSQIKKMLITSAPLASGNAMAARMEALQDFLSLIEKNSWEALIEKVKEDPSLAFSPLSGASSWSSGSQGNLALHEVCKQQPTVAVIEALMQAYPDAVRTRGQWGYLPLHYV